jgi:hypothetical protein
MQIRLTLNLIIPPTARNDHYPRSATKDCQWLHRDQEEVGVCGARFAQPRKPGSRARPLRNGKFHTCFMAASRLGKTKSKAKAKLRKVSTCWKRFNKLWTAAWLGIAPRRPSTQIRLAPWCRPDSASTPTNAAALRAPSARRSNCKLNLVAKKSN